METAKSRLNRLWTRRQAFLQDEPKCRVVEDKLVLDTNVAPRHRNYLRDILYSGQNVIAYPLFALFNRLISRDNLLLYNVDINL